MFRKADPRHEGFVVHRIPIIVFALLLPTVAASQTNIRAHYADGQAWIVWETTAPDPDTYAVYRSDAPFTDTSQAELIGRLYPSEWDAAAVRDQLTEIGFAGFVNWQIPDASGGTLALAADDALFVDTVHEGPGGARWYGVVKWGDTAVTAGVNLIDVDWTFAPGEPPQCHLQFDGALPSGYPLRVYAMWAHGHDDDGSARPDFPVMGNRHKNGMPSMFIISESLTPGPPPVPVTYWLHGGDGEANQSLATGRPRLDIEPVEGILVAHNDDFQRPLPDPSGAWILDHYSESNSHWFGYVRTYDPFAPMFVVADTDTVVNYTQRRLRWIHEWLIEHENVDPARTAIQGHSMGAAGSTHMGKTFPELFSTVTIYNNGFHGPKDAPIITDGLSLFGTPDQDLPTTLRRDGGEVVRAYEIFDITTRISSKRDFPLFRIFNGKNDCCGAMEWDAEVVAEYHAADSIGVGAHLYWDLREHGWSGIPGYWTEGGADADQTGRDDVATQERYRTDRSYPAFFNHRLMDDAVTGDPGDGSLGSASGDDWGTWGGYHSWDLDTLVDTPAAWEARVFVTGLSAAHPKDNCPFDSLRSDVAIRKPQEFRPLPGSVVGWMTMAANGDTLQTGSETVESDGLVLARGVWITRDPERRTLRFEVLVPVGVPASTPAAAALQLSPNPFRDRATIRVGDAAHSDRVVTVFDVAGRVVHRMNIREDRGVVWDTTSLAPGVYFVQVAVEGRAGAIRRGIKVD